MSRLLNLKLVKLRMFPIFRNIVLLALQFNIPLVRIIDQLTNQLSAVPKIPDAILANFSDPPTPM